MKRNERDPGLLIEMSDVSITLLPSALDDWRIGPEDRRRPPRQVVVRLDVLSGGRLRQLDHDWRRDIVPTLRYSVPPSR